MAMAAQAPSGTAWFTAVCFQRICDPAQVNWRARDCGGFNSPWILLVAPARVLPRHLPGQRRDRRVHGRPSVRARIAPVPADQLPVKRSSVTGVTSRLVRSVLAAIGPGRRAPPVGPAQPGPGVLPP